MSEGTSASALVLGAPFDHSPQKLGDCTEAPNILRVVSRDLSLVQGFIFFQQDRRKALQQLSISDAGNIDPAPGETTAEYLTRVRKVVSCIALAGKVPLILGGDHVVTLPILQGISEHFRCLQVVHLDAHSDVQTLSNFSVPTNANVVSYASALPSITKWFQIGIRAIGRHAPEFPTNVICVKSGELAGHLDPDVPVYLTVDTDAFDPSIMPAVTYPVPRGLFFQDLDNVINALKASGSPLVGVDWVEFNPSFDSRHGLTASSVLTALISILELIEQKQQQER